MFKKIKVTTSNNTKRFTLFNVEFQLNFKNKNITCLYIKFLKTNITHYIEPNHAENYSTYFED
ncbi:MAG TPA: hypothetical protein DG048_11185 [Pseudoalteromonas sp.]|nr:hypothetical protein [Pseudoalteromonas sp.]